MGDNEGDTDNDVATDAVSYELIYDLAKTGQIDKIKQLVPKRKPLDNELDIMDIGVGLGIPELVKYAIELGYRVNYYDNTDHHTGLLYAVESGNVETVKVMVESGAYLEDPENIVHSVLYLIDSKYFHSEIDNTSTACEMTKFLIRSGLNCRAGLYHETPRCKGYYTWNPDVLKLLQVESLKQWEKYLQMLVSVLKQCGNEVTGYFTEYITKNWDLDILCEWTDLREVQPER